MEEQGQEIYGNPNDELSLGEIIQVVIDYFNEVLRNWFLILLFIIPPLLYFAYTAYIDIPTYSATSTFMLNDDDEGDITGIGGLLGSLGLGRGKKSESSLQKVLQLFESRRIVEATLFTETEIEDRTDFFANYIIEQYGFHNIIEESGKASALLELEDFRFAHSNLDSFSIEEKTVLAILYNKVSGDPGAGLPPMISSKLDETSGIMRLSVTSRTETLTIKMLETFYQKLSDYYINKTVEKQQKIKNIIQLKKDSIDLALSTAEYRLADFEDTHRKMVTVKGELKRTKLKRQEMILSAMYIEVIKHLEKADFALRQKTPYVQVIDPPKTPIFPSKKSLFMGIVMGVAIGLGLGLVFVVLRKLVRDALGRTKRSNSSQ